MHSKIENLNKLLQKKLIHLVVSRPSLFLFALIYASQIFSPAWAMLESGDDLKPKSSPKNLMSLPRAFLVKVTTFLDPGSLCYLRSVNHSFNQIIPQPPTIIENGRRVSNKSTTSNHDSWDFSSYFKEDSTVPYSYDAENLGAYLQYSTNLHALDLLREYQVEDSGKIFSYLTTLTNLRSLKLPWLVWTHDESFPLWLRKNIYLQHLTLERSKQFQNDAETLVALSLLTNLQRLTVGAVGLEDIQTLTDALPYLKYLTTLKLPHHKLGREGGKTLGPALIQCTALEELDLEARRAKYDCTPEIAFTLPKIGNLKKLKFLISDEGAVSLTPVLPLLSSLKTLSVRFPLDPRNQYFLAALGFCSALENLEISFLMSMSSSRNYPFSHIKRLTQLKSLVLEYDPIQDVKSHQLLGSMLLNLSKLEKLELNLSSGSQLNIHTLSPFFSKLENLQFLSLSGLSPLKENKAVALAKMLSHLSRLEKLDMKESLSKTTLEKIIPSLQLAPHLKELHFLCGKDFQSLFLILTQLRTLERLHMLVFEQGDLGSLRGLKNTLRKSQHVLQQSHLKEIYWDGYHLWKHEEEAQILKELGVIFNSLPALERAYFPKHAMTPTGRHFLRTTAPSVRLCLYLGFINKIASTQ